MEMLYGTWSLTSTKSSYINRTAEKVDDNGVAIEPVSFHPHFIHKSFNNRKHAELFANQYKDASVCNITTDPGCTGSYFGIHYGVHPDSGPIREWVVGSRAGASYLTYARKKFWPKEKGSAGFYPLLQDAVAAGPFTNWDRAKQFALNGQIGEGEVDPYGRPLLFQNSR